MTGGGEPHSKTDVVVVVVVVASKAGPAAVAAAAAATAVTWGRASFAMMCDECQLSPLPLSAAQRVSYLGPQSRCHCA